jgi:hypothetical protein
MIDVKPSDFDFTEEQIATAIDGWVNFTAFSGETCGKCGTTANVLNGPGWICICGAFNAQSFRGGPEPHEKPGLGPTAEMIRNGTRKSHKWNLIWQELHA